MSSAPIAGPLVGVRVVELAGIGPVPHAGMVLADLGADVVRVDGPAGRRLELGSAGRADATLRGRRSVRADLKTAAGRDLVIALATRADVLIEGMRPGVTERLGVGPADCMAGNPRLVYGRMTGWGQEGPWAGRAGHDINYLSVTGTLNAVGDPGEPPTVPLNLVADFGGGSLYLVVGVLAALVERERSGAGQVVDAAMVDGVGSLSQLFWAMRGMGLWSDERGTNLLDGSCPFYDTYLCADGGAVAVGALEPQFYGALLDGLGLSAEDLPPQLDRAGWPVLRRRFEEVFATRSRDEWARRFDGTDACVTPVLTFAEATTHPHLVAREAHFTSEGVVQPAPAPRFGRSVLARPAPPGAPGADLASVLRDWDVTTSTTSA